MVSASGSETSVSNSTPTSAIIYDAYTSITKKNKTLNKKLNVNKYKTNVNKSHIWVSTTNDREQDEENKQANGKRKHCVVEDSSIKILYSFPYCEEGIGKAGV